MAVQVASASEIPFQLPRLPPGLEAIYQACLSIYPNHRNPLQVSTKVKSWLGGPDPLDFISMYPNNGRAFNGWDHWHYVGMGLSDLYGDGRAHSGENRGDALSGLGFELTFRLRREPGQDNPPTWPAALLQHLARTALSSSSGTEGRRLEPGDSRPWSVPLDGRTDSRIQHIIFCEDPQLHPIRTPSGIVQFVQVVGITAEELKAAEEWAGLGLLNLLRSREETGGPLLVTDLRRSVDLFQIDPEARATVDRGIKLDGSILAGLSGTCSWSEWLPGSNKQPLSPTKCTDSSPSACNSGTEVTKSPLPGAELLPLGAESEPVLRLNAVEITMDADSAAYLRVMMNGRVLHGKQFAFKDIGQGSLVTFSPPGAENFRANRNDPYVACGKSLSICLSERLQSLISEVINIDKIGIERIERRICYQWPDHGLKITIRPS